MNLLSEIPWDVTEPYELTAVCCWPPLQINAATVKNKQESRTVCVRNGRISHERRGGCIHGKQQEIGPLYVRKKQEAESPSLDWNITRFQLG